MITHIFNSSIVSGPEMLVIPALKKLTEPVSIIFLSETRLASESEKPIDFARSFGHEVYSVPVRGRFDPKAFRELRKLLDQIKPRITHAHDVKASLYLHRAKKLGPGFPGRIVSTHHGASYRKGKIRLYEEYYVRFVLPHFDRVLSVCELDRKSIIRRGVEPERVSIHLNGTDRTLIAANARAAETLRIRNQWRDQMTRLPEAEDAIFLGAVARLSSEKRHDRMLRVLADLKKNEKTFGTQKTIMLFFGIGPEESALRKLAQTLSVDDRVYFMGYSKTISQEMAGFDALLCLSDGEGIPINLLEAGWAGTPVISTRVGGIPDLISSREVGFLLDKSESDSQLAAHIAKILSSKAHLIEVGQAYQKRVTEFFSHSAWLKALEREYEAVQSFN